MSSKKAKQNLQRSENTVATSGLREIAVNRVATTSVATTANRLVETPAIRANPDKATTSWLHVIEQSHSKSSINVVKLTTSTEVHGAAATEPRSPRTSQHDESNKENMVAPKTPVTLDRKIADQQNNPSASKTDSTPVATVSALFSFTCFSIRLVNACICVSCRS